LAQGSLAPQGALEREWQAAPEAGQSCSAPWSAIEQLFLFDIW
jgi:hypothetical protein